jgi:hypothetical protein
VIALEDRISLAPGVTLDGAVVVDAVRRLRVPASPAAALVLAHADGRTISAVGDILTRHGAEDGRRDALEFSGELSRRLLVNVRIRPAALVSRAVFAARRGVILHPPPRRVRSLPVGLAASACLIAAAVAPVALLLRAWALILGVALGVVLHEAAHAIALNGIPRALVLNGARPSLLHPRLGPTRTIVVAAAGPVVPSLTAVVTLALWHASAPACAALAAHALGLTVLAPDGRSACGLS